MMKYIWLGIAFLVATGCQEANYRNQEPIVIEARYMRYACGDWNDDMQVEAVSDSSYNDLIGQDIDPIFESGLNELGALFDENETEAYGFSFKLTGYISAINLFGCDTDNPKFYITDITRLDGSPFIK